MLVVDVRNVAFLGVRRDDQQGNANAQTVIVQILWRLRIVQSAVVPEDEDCGAPERRFTDRVDERCDPRGSGVGVASPVIGVSQVGVIHVTSRRLPSATSFKNCGGDEMMSFFQSGP